MTNTPIVDRILVARAVVARLGERDLFGWWDDNALTASGQFVMTRLLPRTAAVTQLEVALEAAAIRHHALVPQPTRLTLFSLPAPREAEVRRRLLAMKRGEVAPGVDVDGLMRLQPGRPVADLLREHGLAQAEELARAARIAPSGRVLELGALTSDAWHNDARLGRALDLLVAGYTASGRGNLIVPVLSMTG